MCNKIECAHGSKGIPIVKGNMEIGVGIERENSRSILPEAYGVPVFRAAGQQKDVLRYLSLYITGQV